MKVRIGKDIKIRWEVTINNNKVTSNDDLTLILTTPRLEIKKLDYIIEDGVIITYIKGNEQLYLGDYNLTLWYNFNKENQSAIDKLEAFTLVPFTDDEDDDINEITELQLTGNCVISGDSAYEIWLKNGNAGTQEDFLLSLKGADGDKGDKGEKGDKGDKGDGADSPFIYADEVKYSAIQDNAINVKSTGINSFAVGLNSIASGDYSVAMGRSNYASGRGGIALAGITYKIYFTGDAGTTTYVTSFQTWETPYLVGMPVYVNTTDVSEPAYITAAKLNENNEVVVTLDRTLNPDEAVNAVGWNPVFNIAKGSSSFASGGLVLGNQSAVVSGGRNIINGTHGLAGGYGNILEKNYAFSAGYCNRIKGAYGAALGRSNEVAESATALGVAANANGVGSLALGGGAITIYVTATDTPCKYIIDPSWNISHNKFESLIKGGKVYEVENNTVSYSKPIAITDVEVVDGVYYITTERELKNITSHTRLGLNITKANGTNSVVFGNNAALGGKDFVAGQMNLSKVEGSVVFGYSNISENTQNFINGSWLNTKNEFETALGTKNRTNTGATRAEQTIFSVGNGDDVPSINGLYQMGEGKNALEIMRNGDIYFGGYGTGTKFYDADTNTLNITPTSITNGTGTNSSLQVNAYNCEATGINSIATGVKSIASGNYSVAMGRHSAALGRGSVALGGLTKGFTFTGAAGATRYSTNLTDVYANALYVGQRCHISTEGNDEEYYTIQSWEIVDDVYYITLDRTIDANNDVSTTLYILANAAMGNNAIAMGGVAKGSNSVTLGQWNLVNGGASVALGSNNLNGGTYSFSAGYKNEVDGTAALALGHTNKAVGGQAIAIGFGNEATEPVAIAIGNKNTVPKQSAVAIGVLNDSIGSCSVAIGYRNKAHHHGTVTLGGYTTATNQGEVAVGIGNISHSGTRFSVGGGNELLYYDETTNKNLFEIMSNGDIWVGNYGTGKQLWDVATSTSPLVEEIVNKILNKQ